MSKWVFISPNYQFNIAQLWLYNLQNMLTVLKHATDMLINTSYILKCYKHARNMLEMC